MEKEFIQQFLTKIHADSYLSKFVVGRYDWLSWKTQYNNYHKEELEKISEIQSALINARKFAEKWFADKDMPEIKIIVGVGACNGYCEVSGHSICIYIDGINILKVKDPYQLLLNTALHEYVHAARIVNDKLKSTELLNELVVEEGLATNIAEVLSSYSWIRTINPDLNNISNLKRTLGVMLSNWDTKEAQIINSLFYYGNIENRILPGSGYCAASILINCWLSKYKVSIDSALNISTEEIAEKLFAEAGSLI